MSLSDVRKQLQKGFLFAIVTGFIIILMFLNTDNDKYAFWLLVIPMVIYIIYGHQISNKYKYLPEFADAVYYLGFTFTLMSLLGATLFEKLSADPEKTISYFGMALMTTILGLIYRNYHMQFTDLNEDVYEKAKEQIELEMSHFKTLVDDITIRLETLTQSVENISNTLIDTLPNKLTEAVENVDDRLLSAFSKLENDMNEIDVVFRESINRVSSLYDELNQQNTTTIRHMVNSLDGLSTNFNSSVNRIETASNQTAQLSENLRTNLTLFNEQLSDGAEGNGYLDTIVNSVKTSSDEINQLSTTIQQLNGSFTQNLDSLQQTSQIIAQEISQIEKIFEDVENHIIKKFS